jgi:two-component sensor histidine kinase
MNIRVEQFSTDNSNPILNVANDGTVLYSNEAGGYLLSECGTETDLIDSEVLEAFRESQDRVISMALIHEELYKGGGFETLNFAPYIEELAEILLRTYSLGKTGISLKLDLAENVFLDMDTAVPLGMIVNELVSNSLKHAFSYRSEGEILIILRREETGEDFKTRKRRV